MKKIILIDSYRHILIKEFYDGYGEIYIKPKRLISFRFIQNYSPISKESVFRNQNIDIESFKKACYNS